MWLQKAQISYSSVNLATQRCSLNVQALYRSHFLSLLAHRASNLCSQSEKLRNRIQHELLSAIVFLYDLLCKGYVHVQECWRKDPAIFFSSWYVSMLVLLTVGTLSWRVHHLSTSCNNMVIITGYGGHRQVFLL